MRVYFPPMPPKPKGATEEECRAMYESYKSELVRLNPNHFNPDGTRKTLWQSIAGLFNK